LDEADLTVAVSGKCEKRKKQKKKKATKNDAPLSCRVLLGGPVFARFRPNEHLVRAVISTTERLGFVGRFVVPSPPWSPSAAHGDGVQGWHLVYALAVLLPYISLAVVMLECVHAATGGTGDSDSDEDGSSTWSNSYLDPDA
jgi:hypothetical protein